MSALTVLYLVLPLPVALLMHEAEEIALHHRWMVKNEERLNSRFPRQKPMIMQLTQLSYWGASIAALEKLALVLLATGWVLVGGTWATQVWAAVFLAFVTNLLMHVMQGLVIRDYVPGLVTAVLLLPWAMLGLHSIWLGLSMIELLACAVVGITGMLLNLRLTHRLGKLIRR